MGFRISETLRTRLLHAAWRPLVWVLVSGSIVVSLILILTIRTQTTALEETTDITADAYNINEYAFPVGVNPTTKTVTENPAVEYYLNTFIASNHTPTPLADSWRTRILARLALQSWYQNLASPISRVLVIESGQRKEQIVANFTKILGWNSTEQKKFLEKISSEVPVLPDGKLYPGVYVVDKAADGETVARIIADRFNAEVRSRYSNDIEEIVPLRDILIIASLIEREAYDFEDMRYISGIIWNRLFIDMRLQLDATMQYAKTSKRNPSTVTNWWPVPTPADKAINSPYNTYRQTGLPPGPIANPSIDAIVAALNPRDTDCLFYFHDDDGSFTCTNTYPEHVAALQSTFGRGK